MLEEIDYRWPVLIAADIIGICGKLCWWDLGLLREFWTMSMDHCIEVY